MKTKLFIGAAILALGFAAAPALAQDIDTTAAFTGDITSFGTPNTATYGQTFTVGQESHLDSFTMYLDGGNGNLDFRAYVYAWGGSRAGGPQLFASDVQHFAGTALGNPTAFTFDTGGMALLTGGQYVAFLSTSGMQGPSAYAYMPYSGDFGSDAYAGGDFVYINNGNDFAALTGQDWAATGGAFGDVHFNAEFSGGPTGVPEPAAWAMLIGGFGLAGGMIRARSRKVTFA